MDFSLWHNLNNVHLPKPISRSLSSVYIWILSETFKFRAFRHAILIHLPKLSKSNYACCYFKWNKTINSITFHWIPNVGPYRRMVRISFTDSIPFPFRFSNEEIKTHNNENNNISVSREYLRWSGSHKNKLILCISFRPRLLILILFLGRRKKREILFSKERAAITAFAALCYFFFWSFLLAFFAWDNIKKKKFLIY